MRTTTIRVHPELSGTAKPAPVGYSPAARHLIGHPELSDGAFRTWVAISSRCFGDSNICRARIRQIAEDSAHCRRTVQVHFDELTRLGLIARRMDPDLPGGPWLTYLLVDPRGLVFGDQGTTPPLKLRHPAQWSAPPGADSCTPVLELDIPLDKSPPIRPPHQGGGMDDSSSSARRRTRRPYIHDYMDRLEAWARGELDEPQEEN